MLFTQGGGNENSNRKEPTKMCMVDLYYSCIDTDSSCDLGWLSDVIKYYFFRWSAFDNGYFFSTSLVFL